ncbi:MAG: hypothetical protein AMJ65_09690 [Phycisphaerae bacterium SG8_4]|nr:MAG: hypothetical protein AMJ65_09690 [Phycisphaerae bacterium SG8_4]
MTTNGFPHWEKALHEYSTLLKELAGVQGKRLKLEAVRDDLYDEAYLRARTLTVMGKPMSVDDAKATARLDKQYRSARDDVLRCAGEESYVQGRIKAAEWWFKMTQSEASWNKAQMQIL